MIGGTVAAVGVVQGRGLHSPASARETLGVELPWLAGLPFDRLFDLKARVPVTSGRETRAERIRTAAGETDSDSDHGAHRLNKVAAQNAETQ
ncbi:hypothetical protein [Streptomyces sp. WM4235]|uniref:hypothetical protein n=1 Tax=Streptomyces sp. WM4235 TaxID=1415551 RepID=UPI000AC3237B|nr:hypothetical protein [Streptomyces sp. WM4235]